MKDTSRLIKIKHNGQAGRLGMVVSVVLLSSVLAGCESSQILDVSGLLSSGSAKSTDDSAVAQKTDTKNQPQKETATGDGAKSEAIDEEKIVLRGPDADASTKPDSYHSLSEQPENPPKTLDVKEKNKEISELKNLSKTHVKDREAELESRAVKPVPVKKPKDDGILAFNWLKSDGTKRTGLTPPEKLRLSRIKPAAPGSNTTPDNTATVASRLPDTRTGLRTTPLIPSVPEKEKTAKKVDTVKKQAPREEVLKTPQNTGKRPSAKNPKIIFFTKGSGKLTKSQQKPLDEIARFRDDSGSNIYVLGFSQTDPAASNEANIDSQDLAISRANQVAAGLRKRGFPADQVVVQIIDELPEKGKKSSTETQRVEVYFENAETAKKTASSTPKRAPKKSPLDFLKGKPFEYSGSEN